MEPPRHRVEPGPVAVTGANGFVARNLRRLLDARRIPAVAVARRDFVAYRHETKVVSPGYAEDDILPELRRCSGLVHLVGIGRQAAGSTYTSANVDLTGRVIRMCKEAGTGRLVYCSGLGVSDGATTDYFISKLCAEREIAGSGLDYAIFRPSYIMGADDPLTRNIRRQASAGPVIVPGSGGFPVQPVSVDDACRVLLMSVADGRFSRRTLDLVGPRTMTFEELVRRIVCGRAPVKRMSLERAYLEAIRNPRFPYGIDDLNILVGRYEGDFGELAGLAGFDFTAVP